MTGQPKVGRRAALTAAWKDAQSVVQSAGLTAEMKADSRETMKAALRAWPKVYRMAEASVVVMAATMVALMVRVLADQKVT